MGTEPVSFVLLLLDGVDPFNTRHGQELAARPIVKNGGREGLWLRLHEE